MLQFIMDVYNFFSVAPDATLCNPLLLGALIGGGVGLLKNRLVDKPAADKERQYQAETARWSPWTGLQSKYVQDPSIFGGMLQGGMAGAAFGQGIGAQEAAAARDEKILNILGKQGGNSSGYLGLLSQAPASGLGMNYDLSSGINQMPYRFPYMNSGV